MSANSTFKTPTLGVDTFSELAFLKLSYVQLAWINRQTTLLCIVQTVFFVGVFQFILLAMSLICNVINPKIRSLWIYRVTHKGWGFNDDLKFFKYNDLKIEISILLCIISLNMPWQEKQLKNRTVVSEVLFFMGHPVNPKWSDFRVYHITN